MFKYIADIILNSPQYYLLKLILLPQKYKPKVITLLQFEKTRAIFQLDNKYILKVLIKKVMTMQCFQTLAHILVDLMKQISLM